MGLRYTDRAKRDLETAFHWYEKQSYGLGNNFLNSVEAGIHKILENPKLYKIQHANFHACIIRRFPFSIFYTLEDEGIVVHAIFDDRRDPGGRP